MPRLYIFADEAGDFEFSQGPNISRYFILCTVSMRSCDVANDLLALRRKLAWEGQELGEYCHATTDTQAVRDLVYETICRHDFTVHATIMEKSKAQPQVRISQPRFYQYGWFYHFKHGTSKIIESAPELLVATASIGTKKERAAFESAIDDVMRQTVLATKWATDFCPASADPCLQVADYCAWAIQRKWERGDERSYVYIQDRIAYEYELWEYGTKHYY